jgi:hypothetical protein
MVAILKTSQIQEPSASSANMVLNSNGSIIMNSASGIILNSNNRPMVAQTGGILQVVSANKTDSFSTSSTSYVDVTGLSLSITPSTTSSKILIYFQLMMTSVNLTYAQIVRNSTAIGIGDLVGSRVQATVGDGNRANDSNLIFSYSNMFLDSPATSSATTYKIQIRTENGTNPSYVNQTINDSNSSTGFRGLCNITAMEIAQ